MSNSTSTATAETSTGLSLPKEASALDAVRAQSPKTETTPPATVAPKSPAARVARAVGAQVNGTGAIDALLGALTTARLVGVTATADGIAHASIGCVMDSSDRSYRGIEASSVKGSESPRMTFSVQTVNAVLSYVVSFDGGAIAAFPLTVAGMADLYCAVVKIGLHSASAHWHTPHLFACQMLPGTANPAITEAIQTAIRARGGAFKDVTLRPSCFTNGQMGRGRSNPHAPRISSGKRNAVAHGPIGASL